jgi:enamine deaminase RidA (YjgF/YER057c/UK114 family)
MTYEEKLAQAGYSLPAPGGKNTKPFEPAVRTGNLVFVSGNAARVDGALKYAGIVGASITMPQARDAAIVSFINCLKAVRDMVGELEQIERIVNIKGFVASTPAFVDQPEVLNAVSDLVNSVFGEKGRHSRVAVGAASLPGGTPVEVEIIVQVK